MRIVVNDTAASTTGALSILKEFYNYVREHDSENEWIFLLSDNFVESTGNIQVIVREKKGWIGRLFFDLFTGASYLKSLNADVVFSLQNTLTNGYRGRQVLYVHQPLGFQKVKNFSFLKGEEREYAIYQHIISRLINKSIKSASHVIVQTKWMKDAVINRTGISAGKISNVLPDVSDLSSYRIHTAPKSGEFFFPSGDILYKNHRLLYDAATILLNRGVKDYHITLTLNEKEFEALLTDTAKDSEVMSHFTTGGRMEREDVFGKYMTSTLLFPSYIETFGYPLAEGRQIGTYIIAADTPFARELLEGYPNAYYHEPFDAEALADHMQAIIEGKYEYSDIPDSDSIDLSVNSWGEIVSIITSEAKTDTTM